jgi:hypothetical protein
MVRSHRKHSIKIIEQVRSLRKEGIGWVDISKITGMPTRSIRDYCKDIKLKPKDPLYSDDIKILARILRENGNSWGTISKILSIDSISTIRQWCKDISVPVDKIKESNKKIAVSMRENGKSWKDISKNLNISIGEARSWCKNVRPMNQQFNSIKCG